MESACFCPEMCFIELQCSGLNLAAGLESIFDVAPSKDNKNNPEVNLP